MDVTGNRNKVRCKQQYCKEQYCIGTWNVRSLIQGKFSLPQFSHLVVSDSLPPPWNAACQASLSINNAQSLFKLISTELVMPSNYLILCCTLLLCLQSFPASGAFHESAFRIRWPKYWSFSFNINPSNKHPGLIFFIIISNSPFRFFCAFFGICVSGISVSHLSYYNKMYLHKFKGSQLNKSEQHRCQLIHSTLLEMETD